MVIELTDEAERSLNSRDIKPQLVLKIEGVSTVFGTIKVLDYVKIGDTGLEIGDDWNIGDLNVAEDQLDIISKKGTTQSITQQLEQDKGAVSSVSSMTIALVDYQERITNLISPGEVVEDLLGRKAQLWLGFDRTAYPQDFIIIFRGVIDDIDSQAGTITLTLSHPDQKKRAQPFAKGSTKLNGAHNNSVTTITVTSTADFIAPSTGPSGVNDTSLLHYIRIDDEVIRFTGKTGTTFTGCTRAQLGTVAAAHDTDASVDSYYRLTGNIIDLALKIMLSGWGTYFKTGVVVSTVETVYTNSLFFADIDIEVEYGLTVGDWVTTTGMSNGANNFSMRQITALYKDNTGSWIVVNGAGLVNEPTAAGTVSFRSQYDAYGAGVDNSAPGLKMSPDEVDVAEHTRLQSLFFSSFDMDIYLKDAPASGKELIEKEIYLPAACYAIPRKSRSSLGYHIGPLPSQDIITLDKTNIIKPQDVGIKRSLGKNFYNTMVVAYDEDPITDEFKSGYITTDADSMSRIPVGSRALVIKAKGLRRILNGANLAATGADRRLNRYKFGAEYIKKVQVHYGTGFIAEVGDIVFFDGTDLNISDTKHGDRNFRPRYFEIVNKSLSIMEGRVELSLIDTSFEVGTRYGLIGLSSRILSGISTTRFEVEEHFFSVFGANEGAKWSRYDSPAVMVRSGSTTNDGRIITNVSGNIIDVSPALSFTPSAGDLMQLSSYNYQTDQLKALYAHMTDAAEFDDGAGQYVLL